MNPESPPAFIMNKKDIRKAYIRSSKKGGQNVNKVSSCVQLTHMPTGIQVKVQDTRDRYKNEEIAYQRIFDKLKAIDDIKNYNDVENSRKEQFGKYGRGDKRRTYRIKEDIVQDHITGKSCTWKEVLKGKLDLLF